MRHSRKAVMREHYKLYLRKHIFNGRYFVRNMQIAVGCILVVALLIGLLIAGNLAGDKTVQADAGINVKDALFGNQDVEETVAVNTTQETTTEVVTTEVLTSEELTEVASNLASKQADQEEEALTEQEKKDQQSKFSDRCIANVEETLNIRKNPDADSEFVGSMNPGAIAKVLGTEGEWTKIKSGDVEGYVLTEYVLTGEAAEDFSQKYVTLRGTILEDGVNVREEKSTDSDIVAVLDKDATVTVEEIPDDQEDTEDRAEKTEQTTAVEETEAAEEEQTSEAVSDDSKTEESEATTQEADQQKETTETTTQQQEKAATDSITWLAVSLEDGTSGYVSTDLVDVEELYELAVSAEELDRIAQEKAAEEEAARKAAEEEAARKYAAAQAANSSSNTSSSTGGDSYQGATTTPVTATESGECIGTFTITAYCGCSKCSGGNNKTASGTTPTEGRTIAADTSILPYGTKVVIDGIVYTVEDCGSGVSGNHIDIFFATHDKAMAYGRKTVKVYKY